MNTKDTQTVVDFERFLHRCETSKPARTQACHDVFRAIATDLLAGRRVKIAKLSWDKMDECDPSQLTLLVETVNGLSAAGLAA